MEHLILSNRQPYLPNKSCDFFYFNDDASIYYLDRNMFPEVTFENSPQEVELILCNHIDTVNIQNPKKQTCVLTNHGIVTDVIFKDN